MALLDLLVAAKLGREVDAVRAAEGWKWTEAYLDFPHAHGMRRTYPHPVELSAEDKSALEAAQIEFDRLSEQHQTADELPEDVDAKFGKLRPRPSVWKRNGRPTILTMSRAAVLRTDALLPFFVASGPDGAPPPSGQALKVW